MNAVRITLTTQDDSKNKNGKGFEMKSLSHGIGQFCPKKLPIRSGIVRTIVAAASTFIMSFILLDMIDA